MKEELETIDLAYIFNLLRRRILWIILAVLLGCGIMYAYVKYTVAPTYTAVISFCVDISQTEANTTTSSGISLTYQQQMAIKQLMHTDAEIIRHAAVTEIVAEKMNNKYTAGQLSSMISVSIPEDSVILDVYVTAYNPQDAQMICNYLDEYGTTKIQQITKTDIQALKSADLPGSSSTPVKRYVMIGALIGLIVSCAIIIIIGLFDKTIKSEEEFKKRIDVPVLGKIPFMQSATETAKRKEN